MKATILLTSAGGLVVPGMIKSLRSQRENRFRIIAVDTQPHAVGFYFADKSYCVLHGNDRDYAAMILKIARKEKVEVILPLSDEEVLALSYQKDIFKKYGIVVACSDYDMVKIASDKAEMLSFLKQKGIPVPAYTTPYNLRGLEKDVLSLGYPDVPVVFKPRASRGARGFWLIHPHANKKGSLIFGRDRQEITLPVLLRCLREARKFPQVMVMEYLDGSDFNVDVLARGGECFYVIPNQRIEPNAGPVRVGIIKHNREVETTVRKIIKSFTFDYCINVEVAYSLNRKAPLPYEINPRISAPIIANKAAGVDLLLETIKMAKGISVNKGLDFKKIRMCRFWDEVYEGSKNKY